ncbi:putative CoA-substrate-specific enzyme activase [Anaerobacterium chartisolvens]|uniref:Putative CoA-substrate-specific enzyme activase n=1 Tax=Anaerobacterium chartisolvens TaxID=1297424 RepID=A0A369BF82_9FIRM|nr:acyl-CoA dehydratase activase [Anaerobacterium chartisolvens]RCX20203.1 putative CoA-substrate-specific enzyme activase [Anaerobacterium chartisolvens]
MRVLGIDLGSRSVKIAIFENDMLVCKRVIDTFKFYKNYCTSVDGKLEVDFELLEVGSADRIVSTGYGRNNINVCNADIMLELKAHTYGALLQTGLKNFTLLDIGGQDSKAVLVRDGKMADMLLNDKCAASCGRYLENMAGVLGIKIEEIAKYYDNPAELSSTCAVFGESELIGRISEGIALEHLAAGVNYSLFKRVKPMIERFQGESLVVTGGVANNSALLHYIKTETSFKQVEVPREAQLNGAIGCCAYGLERALKR